MRGMTVRASERRVPELTLGWRLKMSLGDMQVQDMADQLGVSRATVSRWMGDHGEPPRKAFLKQWALISGVDYEWLETGSLPTPPDSSDTKSETTREYVPLLGHGTITELTRFAPPPVRRPYVYALSLLATAA